jgi:hypothetical protein
MSTRYTSLVRTAIESVITSFIDNANDSGDKLDIAEIGQFLVDNSSAMEEGIQGLLAQFVVRDQD